jgi:FKBP-type peptidyl-prolyl cis-trans isomerase (trigger factor)
MKVEVKKIDKLKREIKISHSGENFLEERNKIYQEIGKNLKVPGFRPGSTPIEVLEKHHAKVLKEEYLRKALPFYYEKALEAEKLIPAGSPQISNVEFSGDSLSFIAEIEIRPELEIKETVYKGIKVKDSEVRVQPEEIERALTNLKEGVKKVITKDLNDEELSKWAGYGDVISFKEAIKTELAVEKIRERRRKIDSQVSTHLLKEVEVALPHEEVQRYHKELVNREIYNLRLRNVPEADIEKYKQDIEDKLKPLAEDEIKLFYILEAIAKKENIKIDNNLGEVVLGFLLSLAEYK